MAEELGKGLGDELLVLEDGGERVLEVTSLYSDVSYGGRTARVHVAEQGEDDLADMMAASISLDVKEGVDPKAKAQNLQAAYPFVTAYAIEDYFDKVYGPSLEALLRLAFGALSVSLVVSGLIMVLFMKMLISQDRFEIGVERLLGFPDGDIKNQYLYRGVMTTLAGIGGGFAMVALVARTALTRAFEGLGLYGFQFSLHPALTFGLSPLLMVLVVTGAVVWSVRDMSSTSIGHMMRG